MLKDRNQDFAGKAAVITAAATGIGREIALGWVRRGGAVHVSDRNAEALAALEAELSQIGPGVIAEPVDVHDSNALRDAVTSAEKAFGGLDTLFNVAGGNLPRNIEEISEDEWFRVVDLNLTSVFRASRAALPLLRRRGGGSIVNIASVAGVMAENRCSAYTASKGAVVMLTRNMAMDFARDNIRVNAVCPGSTSTPRTQSYWASSPTGDSELAPFIPMKRSADAREIADPALFLASEEASYITGISLIVDGGLVAGFRVPTFDRI
ncbi:MAG TPA: SDR family oxidoreductase [Allosphingosinicella sp.]|jgi:NAD(P)-dependent dehydrogenase (short-subunit alcohol dehydrogenase family)